VRGSRLNTVIIVGNFIRGAIRVGPRRHHLTVVDRPVLTIAAATVTGFA